MVMRLLPAMPFLPATTFPVAQDFPIAAPSVPRSASVLTWPIWHIRPLSLPGQKALLYRSGAMRHTVHQDAAAPARQTRRHPPRWSQSADTAAARQTAWRAPAE